MATQKGRNWSSGDIVTAANLSSVERGVSAVSSLYEPTTWANGDTVTAAALNNIEQGIVNADGGGKTWVTLCEEEVTTVQNSNFAYGDLSYSQLIDADTIRVTFNGTEYLCNKLMTDEYGAPYDDATGTFDWSEYPFCIVSDTPNQLATETAGTYDIKIEALQESSGSSDFSTAQVTVNGETIMTMPRVFHAGEDDVPYDTVMGFQGEVTNTSITIALYKGKAIVDISAMSPVISGNISLINETMYLVTGDCTITISSGGSSPQ